MSVHVHSYFPGVTHICDLGLNVKVEVVKASGSLPKALTPGTGAINARELGNA